MFAAAPPRYPAKEEAGGDDADIQDGLVLEAEAIGKLNHLVYHGDRHQLPRCQERESQRRQQEEDGHRVGEADRQHPSRNRSITLDRMGTVSLHVTRVVDQINTRGRKAE